jgi:protein-S-isoprenylcysteine O-methyltransferase Ste14
MYRVACFIEVLVILATHHPSAPFAQRILSTFISNGAAAQHIQITPSFLLGISLGVFGTMLRRMCYRTLGCFFTFELRIQENHELIVTGPYAIIRHPSYTGIILKIIGECCSQVRGSWVSEGGLVDTLGGRILITVWLSIASAVVVSLLLRIPNEDKLLHTKFGKEWEVWVDRVHHRLIPHVY